MNMLLIERAKISINFDICNFSFIFVQNSTIVLQNRSVPWGFYRGIVGVSSWLFYIFSTSVSPFLPPMV